MLNKKYIKQRTILFTITSIVMFIFFYQIPIITDDVYNWQHRDLFNTIPSDINYVINQYGNWSSRTVINFIMYFFSTHNVIYFALTSAFLIFILQLSLSQLFNANKQICLDLCLSLLVLIIPYPYFSTAGWIATTTTYLWPIVAAVYSVNITFRSAYSIKWYQYILASLATIYAANNEQIMIVLFILYIATIIINFTKYKLFKNSKFIHLQFIFVILDFAYFVLCPGNIARSHAETVRWFPEFAKLNIVNKLDIGFMTTGEHILFGNSLVILLLVSLLFLLSMLTSRKMVLSSITLLIVIISNILFDIFLLTGHLHIFFQFPKLGLLRSLDLFTILQFIIYIVFIILIIFDYYYGQNKTLYIEMLILLGAGGLSRVSLGLSPTNYVSATRTFAVLSISILIMCIPVIKEIIKQKKVALIISFLSLFAFCNMLIFSFEIMGANIGKFLPLWLSIW